jgi:hypothetical protein
LLSFFVFSQEKIEGVPIDSSKIEQKKFDTEKIDQYKSQDDFKYNVKKKEKNFLERFWDWLGRFAKRILSWIFDDIGPAVGVLAAILRIIPWLVLGVLLYFIVKFFVGVNYRKSIDDSASIPSIELSDDEELIQNKNLNELVRNAIEQKDYRLAIRFYYLLVLQKLTETELIVWQQEKTNEDFIREVSKFEIADDFTEFTRLYDFVWYGNFEIKENEFLKAETLFKGLTKNIIGQKN